MGPVTESATCSICLAEIEEKPKTEEARVKALACAHIFHKGCIDEWHRREPTCPQCRTIDSGAESFNHQEQQSRRVLQNLAEEQGGRETVERATMGAFSGLFALGTVVDLRELEDIGRTALGS